MQGLHPDRVWERMGDPGGLTLAFGNLGLVGVVRREYWACGCTLHLKNAPLVRVCFGRSGCTLDDTQGPVFTPLELPVTQAACGYMIINVKPKQRNILGKESQKALTLSVSVTWTRAWESPDGSLGPFPPQDNVVARNWLQV